MDPFTDSQRTRRGAQWTAPPVANALARTVATAARWYAWLAERTTLYTRFVLGVSVAICLALVMFGAGEAWYSHRIEMHIQQVESQNARLRADTAATLVQVTWAESDTAIEGAARAMGYARPGEQPVVIVTPRPAPVPLPAPAPAPLPTGSLAAALDSASQQAGGKVSPFQFLFGG